MSGSSERCRQLLFADDYGCSSDNEDTKEKKPADTLFSSKAKGLARSSMVLAEQLDTCDKTCVIRYLGKVSKGQMRGIDEAVKVQLDIIFQQAEKKARQMPKGGEF